MQTTIRLALTALVTFTLAGCDTDESGAYEPTALELNEELTLQSTANHQPISLTCDPDEQASVGGLYYPGWTCADAIANAESNFSSWHYRNACSQQVGSDIGSPVASVEASCFDDGSNAVVSADLCCDPPPGLSCDPSEQASVGGLYYPGWTCADAIAHAESSLSSWHYRNACHQQVGSDISSPVDEALALGCVIDSGSAVVSVDLCCDAPATVSAVPQGSLKMCISGGSSAQMLADCEAGALANLNRYLDGTWSTQDYITHWTDPCPAGTSIVPNSQFYVTNSCNPLPNVGAGCDGVGSFNYEFQLGVQCQ
jgi:hypothetical protein